MKHNALLSLLLGAIISLPVAAQVTAPSPAPGATPKALPGNQVIVQVESAPWSFDAAAMSAGLGQTNLDQRMQYVDELLVRLRLPGEGESAARAWIGELAEGQDALAWTARLMTRDLEQARSTALPFADGFGAGLLTEQQLKVLKQLSIPQSGADVQMRDGADTPGLEQWLNGAQSGATAFPMASIPGQELMNVELQISPSGARLRVMEAPHFAGVDSEGDGLQHWKTELREYVGRDLASILSTYPELVGRLPFQVAGIAPRLGTFLRTDVLGVYTQELTEELYTRLGLAVDQGLEVVRIEPGTIAQLLGVTPGSVVLEVCGATINGERAIAEAMQSSGKTEICVVWIDSSGKRRERTWSNGVTVTLQDAAGSPGQNVQGKGAVEGHQESTGSVDDRQGSDG